MSDGTGSRERLGSASTSAAARWQAILWLGIGGVSCALVSNLEPSLLEEGLVVHVAERLAHGEHLYQDVIAFTGPLPFQLLALVFGVLGEELWLARALVALLHGMSCAALFSLSRRAGAGPAAHACAAGLAAAPALFFPLYSIYYYTTLAFHLSVVTAWTAARAFSDRRVALVTGVGIALVALCKQTIGAALAVGVLGSLWAAGASGATLRWVIGGGVGVAGVTLIGFAATGGTTALAHALLVLPLALEETFRARFPNLWPLGELAPEIEAIRHFYLPPQLAWTLLSSDVVPKPVIAGTQILYGLPFLAAGAHLVCWGLGRVRPAGWIHLALLLTWIVNLFPRSDWGHLAHVLPLAWSHLVLLMAVPVRDEGAWRRLRPAATGSAVIALAAATLGAYGQLQRMAAAEPVSARVPLLPVSPGLQRSAVTRLVHEIQMLTEPDDAIFVPRAEPLLYFASERRNPTPYPGVIPGLRERQQQLIRDALGETRLVVMSDVDQPSMTYYRDVLPEVQEELERRFVLTRSPGARLMSTYTLLEPGPDRGPTAVDLYAIQGGASAYVLDQDYRPERTARFRERIATLRNRRPVVFYLGHGGGGLAYEVDIPDDAVFQGSVGIHTVAGAREVWHVPREIVYRVTVRDGDAEHEIVSQSSDHMDSRMWTDLAGSLARFAGRRVTLRIECRHPQPTFSGEVCYFGSPRIALRP